MRIATVTVTTVLLTAGATLNAAHVARAQSYSSGGSYANPENTTTDMARRRGPCTDPWVTIALERVYGSADRSLCEPKRYNGGSRNSFNLLVHAVGTVAALPVFDLRTGSVRKSSETRGDVFDARGRKLGTVENGEFMVDQTLVSTMVAAGGGNLIGNDGSTLVGNDGASLIGNDSGGLTSALERKLEVGAVSASAVDNYSILSVMKFSAIKAATRRR